MRYLLFLYRIWRDWRSESEPSNAAKSYKDQRHRGQKIIFRKGSEYQEMEKNV